MENEWLSSKKSKKWLTIFLAGQEVIVQVKNYVFKVKKLWSSENSP